MLRLARHLMLAAALASGSRATAQAPVGATVTGTVRERLNDVALPLATVSLDGTDHVVFTRGGGAFAMAGVSPGPHTLRVRQIGFAPATLRVTVPDSGTADAGVTRLERLAVSLASIEVRAQPSECVGTGLSDPGADSMATLLLARLADESDRQRAFAATYPGMLGVIRTREQLDDQAAVMSARSDTVVYSFVDLRPYHVGAVTRKTSFNHYAIQLPTAAQISSAEFVAHHCARYTGTRTVDGVTLAVLEISPTTDVHQPDVAGAVLLTPEGALRRTEFRLTDTGHLGFALGGGVESLSVTNVYRPILGGRMSLLASVLMLQQTRTPYVVGHRRAGFRDHLRAFAIRYTGARPEADTATVTPR